MYEIELKRILDASQNNTLTFFVGAGISKISGAPSWGELINSICDAMGVEKKKHYSSDDYLKLPQMYYYSLENNKKYYEFVKSKIYSESIKPNPIHTEMLKLNPVSFITTNYDNLLEHAAIQRCQSFKVISRDADVSTILGDKFILKLHGDFQYNNFVLKEEDYLNYSENFKLIETVVRSIFATNTVVFIGYSLNDYNVKLILNWAKNLLNENFLRPIFISASDKELTELELSYQQSKGLTVIECSKLVSEAKTYLERYQAVFRALKEFNISTLSGKSDSEAFNMLYNLMKPLDQLNALRVSDVSNKLSPFIRIEETGTIFLSSHNTLLLREFLAIHYASEDEKRNFTNEQLQKYCLVLSVFKKARIAEIVDKRTDSFFITDEISFADENCITFNYPAMVAFTAKSYKSEKDNYKKAFYLSRLGKYDEAFMLFNEVAQKAFFEKKYLLYYLSKTNCIYLQRVIQPLKIQTVFNNLGTIEESSLNDTETENLFNNLPTDFKVSYSNLKELHSVNMLYKYSYSAFSVGQKLKKSVENNSFELGFTSSEQAICKINEYLHFLLGNGICADIFTEFKTTIKNLMSLLVCKYTAQKHKIINDEFLEEFAPKKICFDKIDFYCFIDCFGSKEIYSLFKQQQITTIEFQQMEDIEFSVRNLLTSYKLSLKDVNNCLFKSSLERKIQTCLMLFRYVQLSQDLVNQLCKFLLSNEFSDISIDDKVMFLDYQIARRKMYSAVTAETIECALLSYLDREISTINQKKELLNGENTYHNLVYYIVPPEETFSSRKLSIRISRILDNNIFSMYPHIMKHYYDYLSQYQKKRLVLWANSKLSENFQFSLFFALAQNCNRVDQQVINALKDYLKIQIADANIKNGDNCIRVFTVHKPLEDLVQIGCLCFCKNLNAEDFKEFLGVSDEFDFFISYRDFGFEKFDALWLVHMSDQLLRRISQDESVKEKIRLSIAHHLNNSDDEKNIRDRLDDILIKYFC